MIPCAPGKLGILVTRQGRGVRPKKVSFPSSFDYQTVHTKGGTAQICEQYMYVATPVSLTKTISHCCQKYYALETEEPLLDVQKPFLPGLVP